MGNFIKELTIIDFLGILVPGSFLLLLFNQDYHIRDIWCGYFGNGSAADTVIFLVVGYLVGMLIHELGDLLEKLIWASPWLNPRYYAAKKVYSSTENNAYEPIAPYNMPQIPKTPPEKSKVYANKVFWQFLLSCAGVSAILMLVFFFPVLLRSDNDVVVVAIYTVLGFALLPIVAIALHVTKNGERGTEIEFVKKNAAIQVRIFGKVSASKRQIFDGFYCIMRNLLLAVGIANTYALFLAGSSNFSQKAMAFYRNTSLLILYYIVCTLMVIRCCHYAYLKYKYAYEDYLYLLRQEEQHHSCEKTKSSEG